MLSPDRLAAYIASRICHDLVSPVSGVTSAIDFLDDAGASDMREQANSLLRDSAQKAADKLEFLRYAFGSMGLNEGHADIHQARKITEKYVATYNPSLKWEIDGVHFSYAHARLLMNLVMIAVGAVSRGDIVLRMKQESGGYTMTAIATGRLSRNLKDVYPVLRGEEPEEGWSARTVQPLFAMQLAKGLGGELTASDNGKDEMIVMAVGVRLVDSA